MTRVCLTKTGKVIEVSDKQAALLVGGGRAVYVGAQTATVRPPERAVMSRPEPRKP